ncbi:VOC family protein [Streptomyces sp. NBC_00873]|uniref:VOC family protein n=1 Tax=unclassified Streptomyces TaxID=2593676 RepID=UPI00386B9EF9|nr:VOC family protein [Streptomyces sp. NBC_00873]WTA41947.1 VOC family protein [Streptomyces sp. NBC_00842]
MPTNDTKATYDFYTEVLGFRLVSAVREDRVPSTLEETPFLHTFFALEDGSCMAFFEVRDADYAGRDDGVPKWIRHFAMNVDSAEELDHWKQRLASFGIETLGVVDHEGVWHSLYFFDPNGLRLEITWQSRPLGPQDAQHALELINEWVAETRETGGETA